MDLVALLAELASSYDDSYQDKSIIFRTELAQAKIFGSAELIAQLMDKLIENAIEFSDGKDTPIIISANPTTVGYQVSVENTGPTLPAEMQNQIFNSMVSMRAKREKENAHLGIGLYIVRLISEYHGGKVIAENLPDQTGVKITVSFGGLVNVS